MKSVTYLVLGICLSLSCVFGYSFFNQKAEAQKQTRLQWEYSAITYVYSFNTYKDRVNRIFGMAQICYLQTTGCREVEVRHELDYGTYLQQTGEQESAQTRKFASQRASEIAFQKAMMQLGSEGWEIVSEPDLEFKSVNIDDYNRYATKADLFERQTTKAVYFKRLKTQ